jgi:Concanavalin A-like lectin/glucanases superfamily/Putative binding domain, N-terminal
MPPKDFKRAVHWISFGLLTTLLLWIVSSYSSSSSQSQEARLKLVLESPVLSDFDDWVKKVGNPNSSLNDLDVAKGKSLAATRRELFKELMSLSPKSALEHAVSADVYQRVPASIKNQLETPVNAYGDFLVYVVMLHQDHHSPEMMTGSRIEREVKIGNATYRALVYGRRENITTKLNIPLQGVVLDGVMVVDEEPARRIQPAQAEIGGKLVNFSSSSELETFVQDQVAWEDKIGPVRPDSLEASSPWTEGVKTLLFIRLDFPDRPGEPIDFQNQPLTVERAESLINNQVSPFYMSNSLNQTSLAVTVTPVVRMPQAQSFYFNNFGALKTDAENAARAAGFDPNNFNLDLFAMSRNSGFGYGGIAYVGARGAALNGAFDLRVTAHELGHNYGLLHANLWRTTDGSTIGPGSNVEYGNWFDVMGGGSDSRAHFTTQYKRRLEWLTDASIQVITQDGVYRVFAHDTSTTGIRALKIRKNIDKNYWIEFRQLFTDTPASMNGAIINWDYRNKDFRETEILDMTPATESVWDAPLQIGSVFNDTENRIRITPLGKGNTTPESLDVKVEFNVGCTFSLNQSSQSFTATGGEGSVPVTTLTGCRPLATSNTSWLQPIQDDSTPLRFVVAANYGSSPRTGTLTVAGQTFTVQQGGATTSCAPVPPGLVAWWQGEGNALDQTGTNNGSLVKNPNFAGAKVGAGFLGSFSNVGGGGYAEVPDSPSLTLTKSMSIEGWLKLNATGGYVLQRSNNTSLVGSYEVQVFSGSISFTIWFNGNQGTGISSGPIPLGQFVHFAVTLDDSSSVMAMYINGILVRQFTISQRPQATPGATVKIGNVNGITDELSVYNRALKASEILAIYNAGSASTGATGKCSAVTQVAPKLMLEQAGPTTNQVVALDSVLFLRDPFPVVNPGNLLNLVNDRNTRVLIFVGNLQLAPGETASSVVVNLVDSNNVSHDVAAENVWSGANADFSQISFRLPDGLPPGSCTVTVKLHGQVSNVGTIRIKN